MEAVFRFWNDKRGEFWKSAKMSDIKHHTEKSYAALYYALGIARGLLGDIIDGRFERDDVRRIYEATAAFRIAESIGVKESDVAIDWHAHLSQAEKRKIQGYNSGEAGASLEDGFAPPLDDSGLPEGPPSVD